MIHTTLHTMIPILDLRPAIGEIRQVMSTEWTPSGLIQARIKRSCLRHEIARAALAERAEVSELPVHCCGQLGRMLAAHEATNPGRRASGRSGTAGVRGRAAGAVPGAFQRERLSSLPSEHSVSASQRPCSR